MASSAIRMRSANAVPDARVAHAYEIGREVDDEAGPEVTREEWAKRVERWKDSGLSLGEYSREVGISASSIMCWKRRLDADANTTPGERRTRLAERMLNTTVRDVRGSADFGVSPVPGPIRQRCIRFAPGPRVFENAPSYPLEK